MHPKICDFGLARGDMKDTATKFLTKAGTGTISAFRPFNFTLYRSLSIIHHQPH